jgi:hypothetical protein
VDHLDYQEEHLVLLAAAADQPQAARLLTILPVILVSSLL